MNRLVLTERSGAARQGGFTLVELIAVMLVVGIMAAVAIPRFLDRNAFDARGFADELVASLRFARQQAIAQRRPVCVAVTNGGMTATVANVFGGACARALVDPATGAGLVLNAPSGVAVQAAGLPLTIVFDAAGRPDIGRALTVQGRDVASVITIAAETGYAY